MSEENLPLGEEASVTSLSGSLLESWTDIAYGLLTEPDATMSDLAERPSDIHHKDAAFVACWIVVVTTLVSGMAQIQGANVSLILSALAMAVIGILNWVYISFILQSVARFFGEQPPYRLCLVLIGWASLPIIFAAPIYCFHKIVGNLIFSFMAVPALWSIYLQCLAFRHACKLSRSRAISLFVFGPPLVVLTSVFWATIIFFSFVPVFLRG